MFGSPVSSAHTVFAPILLCIIVLAAQFLTQFTFRFLGGSGDDAPEVSTLEHSLSGSDTKPPHHPAKSDRPEFPNAGAYVRHELKAIIIPKVDFEDATIEEAIDFLRLRSRELSDQPPERAGFSFVIRKARTESGESADINAELNAEAGLGGDDPVQQTLTLKAENVSLYDLLLHVTRKAKLELEITPEGLIVFKPAIAPGHQDAAPPPPDPNDPFTRSPDPFAP